MKTSIDLSKCERLYHERDAADYLGMTISWMRKSRFNGTGPRYIKVGGVHGRAIRYRQRDLEAYVDGNEVDTVDSLDK